LLPARVHRLKLDGFRYHRWFAFYNNYALQLTLAESSVVSGSQGYAVKFGNRSTPSPWNPSKNGTDKADDSQRKFGLVPLVVVALAPTLLISAKAATGTSAASSQLPNPAEFGSPSVTAATKARPERSEWQSLCLDQPHVDCLACLDHCCADHLTRCRGDTDCQKYLRCVDDCRPGRPCSKKCDAPEADSSPTYSVASCTGLYCEQLCGNRASRERKDDRFIPGFISPGLVWSWSTHPTHDHGRGFELSGGYEPKHFIHHLDLGLVYRYQSYGDAFSRSTYATQVNYVGPGGVGLEAGWATRTGIAGAANIGGLHLQPFVSVGILYLGEQILIPTNGAKVEWATNLGLKFPLPHLMLLFLFPSFGGGG